MPVRSGNSLKIPLNHLIITLAHIGETLTGNTEGSCNSNPVTTLPSWQELSFIVKLIR